jgi:hypothetical protein
MGVALHLTRRKNTGGLRLACFLPWLMVTAARCGRPHILCLCPLSHGAIVRAGLQVQRTIRQQNLAC